MNCGNELKMKKWSSQWMQLLQLRKEAWKKFRTSMGFEPVTSRYRCDARAHEFARSQVQTPLKSWIFFFFRLLYTICKNCIHCDDHFFIFNQYLINLIFLAIVFITILISLHNKFQNSLKILICSLLLLRRSTK